MKCLKKYVKEEIIMWWHMHFFRNAPKSKMFIFCFSIETPLSKCPPFLYLIYLTCPIVPIWFCEKWDISKFCIKKKFWEKTKKGTSSKNRKWTSSIFGDFEKTHIPCIINSSFTCFLGHFMFPRKQSIADWQIDHLFAKFNKKTFIALQLSDQ